MKLKRDHFLNYILIWIVLLKKYVNHNKCKKNTPSICSIHLKKQIQGIGVSSDPVSTSCICDLLAYMQPQPLLMGQPVLSFAFEEKSFTVVTNQSLELS